MYDIGQLVNVEKVQKHLEGFTFALCGLIGPVWPAFSFFFLLSFICFCAHFSILCFLFPCPFKIVSN